LLLLFCLFAYLLIWIYAFYLPDLPLAGYLAVLNSTQLQALMLLLLTITTSSLMHEVKKARKREKMTCLLMLFRLASFFFCSSSPSSSSSPPFVACLSFHLFAWHLFACTRILLLLLSTLPAPDSLLVQHTALACWYYLFLLSSSASFPAKKLSWLVFFFIYYALSSRHFLIGTCGKLRTHSQKMH